MSSNKNHNSRRNFLKMAALGSAAIGLAPVTSAFGNLSNNPAGESQSIHPGSGNETAPKGRSVMGLACEPLNTVRIGLIGLGMRGSEAVRRLIQIEGVEIKALADRVQKNLNDASRKLREAGLPVAAEYPEEEDWKKICERDDIDLIYTCTPWYLHTPIAVYAMKHGKHAATEVPAATSLADCWELVNTAEETRRHCMMLDNSGISSVLSFSEGT